MQGRNGFDFHGIDDSCETDDEIVFALFRQHRLERVQVVFQKIVFARVTHPVHVHYRVYLSQLLPITFKNPESDFIVIKRNRVHSCYL